MADNADNSRRLWQVLDITRAMVAASDLDELLGLIIRRSMELLGAERASLFLYDSSRDELISRIAHEAGEIRFSATAGIAGAVVRGRSSLNIPDAYADARFNRQIDSRTGFRTRNILALPLLDYSGALVGVLEVLNKRAGGFDADDLRLAEALAAQAGVALQRARLLEEYAAKQRMEQSLAIARQIQQDLLPKESPRVAGFDIAGWSCPADETGGDIFDFFPMGQGRWAMVLADATGHGIGPALIVAEARAMLRALSMRQAGEGRGPQPDMAEIMAKVNELLVADLSCSRFVTCLFAVLEEAASSVRCVSAGQGPILFYRACQDDFEELPATALPLGVMAEVDFDQCRGPQSRNAGIGDPIQRRLGSGDMMIAITDGFFEAADAAGEQFGMGRVRQIVRDSRALPAGQIIQRLHQAVEQFTGLSRQADDLTAIIVKRISP